MMPICYILGNIREDYTSKVSTNCVALGTIYKACEVGRNYVLDCHQLLFNFKVWLAKPRAQQVQMSDAFSTFQLWFLCKYTTLNADDF